MMTPKLIVGGEDRFVTPPPPDFTDARPLCFGHKRALHISLSAAVPKLSRLGTLKPSRPFPVFQFPKHTTKCHTSLRMYVVRCVQGLLKDRGVGGHAGSGVSITKCKLVNVGWHGGVLLQCGPHLSAAGAKPCE